MVSGLFLGRAYFDYFFSIVACLVILNRLAGSVRAQPEPLTEPEPRRVLLESGAGLQVG